VHHYGGVLEPAWLPRVEAEDRRNEHYQWHGEIPRYLLRRKLAQSWLTVLSSRMEGGANVLTEAIVNGTPALATRISGSIGILGASYAGFFDVADTQGLSSLLRRCEDDQDFYQQLVAQVQQRALLFTPSHEKQAWLKLLADLESA
jgi:glycosyltransferase involved in cell wall biosynthesis